jgi:hypothetical protein
MLRGISQPRKQEKFPQQQFDDGLNAKDNFQFERTVRYRQEGKRT